MVHRRKIEAAVLDGLREVLKQPDYLAIYVKAYNEERSHLVRGASGIAASWNVALARSSGRLSG